MTTRSESGVVGGRPSTVRNASPGRDQEALLGRRSCLAERPGFTDLLCGSSRCWCAGQSVGPSRCAASPLESPNYRNSSVTALLFDCPGKDSIGTDLKVIRQILRLATYSEDGDSIHSHLRKHVLDRFR